MLAFCDHFSPAMGGGAERVAYEVYRRLAQHGVAITVVTTTASSSAWAKSEPRIRVISIPALDLRPFLGLQVSITRGAARVARQALETARPHVLHANSLEFQTSVAAARIARSAGIPLVLTAHIAGFDLLSEPWRTIGTVYERTVGAYLVRSSKQVVAVSEAVAAHLARWPEQHHRVRVVPNGVDHAVFFPPEQRSRQGTVEVMFVGRLIKNKCPDLLLASFKALLKEGVEARLRFVGDGPMCGALRRAVSRDPQIAPAVTFTGVTEQVPSLLREADVVVRPGQTEGMPLAILEAMASGVCVVASDVPGNRGLISHGVTGFLFSVGDENSLTEQLRTVIRDADARTRVAQAAHEESLKYSWDRCAQGMLDVFLETLRGRTMAMT